MRFIEASKKIALAKPVTPQEFKEALISHLEHTINIEAVNGNDTDFTLTGTTGDPGSMTRHARLELDVDIRFEKDSIAKVLVSGHTKTARSLTILYMALFTIFLLVGLLPGSIETNAETSGAMDVLVFLIFGIFIVWDINKKLSEPQAYIQTALESINTRYS